MKVEQGSRHLSRALSEARRFLPYFPIIGVDGYAGEQDGDVVTLFDVYHAATLDDVSQKFREHLPNYVRVHWATYSLSDGWKWVLGAWASDCPDDWEWPLSRR